MAKSNRQVYKIPQPKMPKAVQLESKPEPVVETVGPNNLCYGLFFACLVVGFGADIWLVYLVSHNVVAAYSEHPFNWLSAILYTVLLAMAISLVRGILWGSFVLSATVAARTQSIKAQMDICHWARRFRAILPGGAAWATQAIIQRMITKEEYKEAIALGTEEYEFMTKKNAKDQSLANLCACVSFAYQMQNEQHRAIEWSEKSVKSFDEIFAAIGKSGGINKYAGQSILQTLYIQHAQVLMGLAVSYMSVQNRLKGKENFKEAIQQARKAPDSPQKRDVIRTCEEHLSRLKHF